MKRVKLVISSVTAAIALLAPVQNASPALTSVHETFDAHPDPTRWILQETTFWDAAQQQVLLTGPSDTETGSIFWFQKLNAGKFDASFDFWIGGVSPQGLCFAWVKGPALIGSGHSGMGFYGLEGYGVRFDVNNVFPEEPQNYVAVSRGTSGGWTDLIINADIPEMENAVDASGNPAPFHVETKFNDGRLQLWMSNPTASAPMPVTKVFDYAIPGYTAYDAYFGLTAASSWPGGTHVVDNVAINKWAYAGPDQKVQAGQRVTLKGTGPTDATFFWVQTGGLDLFVASLLPSPNQAEVYFDSPVVEVGFVLTFELTVSSWSEGTATDEVKAFVYAPNPPRVAPFNFRILPLDLHGELGFRLEWDPVFDATSYQIALKLGPEYFWMDSTSDTFHEFMGMVECQTRTVVVRAENQYCYPAIPDPSKHGMPSVEVTYTAMRNLALPSSLGGTRPPAKVIQPGPPCPGWFCFGDGINDGSYSDDNDTYTSEYRAEDLWGYLWIQPYFFDRVVYYTGQFTDRGGWFTSLKVQYTTDGTAWKDAPILDIFPDYNFTDSRTGKKPFTRYDIVIPVLRGLGIRIAGTPGGLDTYTSVAELEVFGNQCRYIVPDGLDAEYPEGSIAILDGTYCFSVFGPIVSYHWELVSAPPGFSVTIENADNAVATFKTPIVAKDEVFIFRLTASDGTNTLTDEVRITIKNLVTTADAGPDQKVLEGSVVTLDGSLSLTTTGTLTYFWAQTVGPDVGITGQTTAVVNFTAPRAWDYAEDLTFQLTVDDGAGGVSTDEVNIEVRNRLAAPAYPLGPGYMKDLLHLGQHPADRILSPLNIDADPLAAFGGQANISPNEGDAYDFTGTNVVVTRNPMVWTRIHEDTGFFGDEPLDNFIQIYHVYVLSPETRDARLHFREDDEVRIWNNGILAARRDSWDGGSDLTENFILSKGVNSMTIKFHAAGGGNCVAVGITDRTDQPYSDLYYSFGPSAILTDAYVARTLPASYQPCQTMDVELSLRVNPDNRPDPLTIREQIPDGLSEADVIAPGAVVAGGDITWTLTGDDVKTSTITYSLKIPAGTTRALGFGGALSFDATSADIFGDLVAYANPRAPSVSLEMLAAAHLTWDPPVTEGVKEYSVYRSVNGGAWEKVASVMGTSYTDNDVVPGSVYSYRVAAVSVTGVEGAPSPPTEEAPLPPMVTREAEDFNYGGGLYPWVTGTTTPATEASSPGCVECTNDFYHPNKSGPRDYRPLDAIGFETVLDDGTTDVWHTSIGWIDPGSWWKYTFNVTQPGWIKLDFRVASPGSGTLAAYWDEALIGTTSYVTGSWHKFTWAALENQVQTTTGEHTLRVQSVAGQLNFDKIAIGFNWSPPNRMIIWSDNFDSYGTTKEVTETAKWLIVDNSNPTDPKAAWQLWDTEKNLGGNPGNLEGMNDKYMISNSDFAPTSEMDEELVSPEIDCTCYGRLQLDFNKNYRVYPDDAENDPQIAEVDIRVYRAASGWGDWVNLLHFDKRMINPTLDPADDTSPERVDLSVYGGRKIQLRWHFYNAFYDYWFAVDDIKVSGEPIPLCIPHAMIRKAANTISLSWGPFCYRKYVVQWTDDLDDGVWQNAPGTWPTPETTWNSCDMGDVRKRFYRVIAWQE